MKRGCTKYDANGNGDFLERTEITGRNCANNDVRKYIALVPQASGLKFLFVSVKLKEGVYISHS